MQHRLQSRKAGRIGCLADRRHRTRLQKIKFAWAGVGIDTSRLRAFVLSPSEQGNIGVPSIRVGNRQSALRAFLIQRHTGLHRPSVGIERKEPLLLRSQPSGSLDAIDWHGQRDIHRVKAVIAGSSQKRLLNQVQIAIGL